MKPHTDYILYDSFSIKFKKKQNKLAVVRGWKKGEKTKGAYQNFWGVMKEFYIHHNCGSGYIIPMHTYLSKCIKTYT